MQDARSLRERGLLQIDARAHEDPPDAARPHHATDPSLIYGITHSLPFT